MDEKRIADKSGPSDDGSNLLHENYLRLKNIADGIISNRYTYLRLKAPGYMDLIVERTWDNRISMAHYFEQNGDLMADPDMEIIVNPEKETAVAATYQLDSLGIFQMAYEGDLLLDPKLAVELNDFLAHWLCNIQMQGHMPYKAHYADGVGCDCQEVEFDKEGNEVEPVTEDDNEMEI